MKSAQIALILFFSISCTSLVFAEEDKTVDATTTNTSATEETKTETGEEKHTENEGGPTQQDPVDTTKDVMSDDVAKDPCHEVLKACDKGYRENGKKTPAWYECMEDIYQLDHPCVMHFKEEMDYIMQPEETGTSKMPFNWMEEEKVFDEHQDYEEDWSDDEQENEWEGEDDDGSVRWMESLRERTHAFPEDKQKCIKEVFRKKELRCAAIGDEWEHKKCVGRTMEKAVLREGKCGLDISSEEDSGRMEMHHMPASEMIPPPKSHEPIMDHRGPDIGRIFGEAVGMLISLSQDPNVPEEFRNEVNDALAWFSEKVGAIAKGEDAMQFVGEAKEKLHRIMEKKGGPGFGGPPPEEMEKEIKKILDMFSKMLDAVPKAFARMQELFAEEGIDVDFGGEWKEIHQHLKKEYEHIKNKCSEAMANNEFHRCFESFHQFPMQMDKLKFHVEDILKRSGVPMSVMGRIMMLIGEEFFDEFEKGSPGPGGPPGPPGMMGPPGMDPASMPMGPPMHIPPSDMDYMGHPMFDGAHEGKKRRYAPPPMEPYSPMPSGVMSPPPQVPEGFHVPDHIKQITDDCYAEGGTDDECKQKVMQNMLEDAFKCDDEVGDAGECIKKMYEEFNMQEGDIELPTAP